MHERKEEEGRKEVHVCSKELCLCMCTYEKRRVCVHVRKGRSVYMHKDVCACVRME